jgi:acyl-CoA thioester hydrolase
LGQLTVVLRGAVKPAWVDYNGHMGDYAYGIVFSDAVTHFMDMIGVDQDFRNKTRQTVYLLEWRISFLQECHEGQAFRVEQQLLDIDGKRFHGYYRMVDEATGTDLAICEQLLMYMQQHDGVPPKACTFPPEIQAKLEGYFQPQKAMPWPAWVGGKLGIRRKP